MSTTVERAIREDRTLTPDEADRFVADLVGRAFGISVEEFVHRVEQGDFEDHPATAQLASLTGAKLPTC